MIGRLATKLYPSIRRYSKTSINMAKKVLVAFDFDHTLIDENSDLYVRKLAPNGGKIPTSIQELYSEQCWTDYMAAIFEYLHENNVTKEEICNNMKEIPFIQGMSELGEQLKQHNVESIIISDSNSVFIDVILKAAGFDSVFHTVYTNPAHFDDSGCLKVAYYQVQDWCKLSTKNMCKGHILQSHITKRKEAENIVFSNVVYVGDGGNDLCPGLTLKEGDLVCARKGFTLMKKIQSGKFPLKADVLFWQNGVEVAKAIAALG